MRALLSLPPHFLPYAFLHDAAFIGILAAVLVFFLIFKRPYFTAFLILVGVFEISIIARIGYSIPLELYPFGIPFITIVSGIIIPYFMQKDNFSSGKWVSYYSSFQVALK
jgi:hypothetical protein